MADARSENLASIAAAIANESARVSAVTAELSAIAVGGSTAGAVDAPAPPRHA